MRRHDVRLVTLSVTLLAGCHAYGTAPWSTDQDASTSLEDAAASLDGGTVSEPDREADASSDASTPDGSEPSANDASTTDASTPEPSDAAPADSGNVDAGDVSAEQLCVDKINEYRATVQLPPLARWTDAEACADGQAKTDALAGKPHSSFLSCSEHGQNECLAMPGTPITVLGGCLEPQWDEGPGTDPTTHGHYINLTSTTFKKVACGFYTTADSKVWVVINFLWVTATNGPRRCLRRPTDTLRSIRGAMRGTESWQTRSKSAA